MPSRKEFGSCGTPCCPGLPQRQFAWSQSSNSEPKRVGSMLQSGTTNLQKASASSSTRSRAASSFAAPGWNQSAASNPIPRKSLMNELNSRLETDFLGAKHIPAARLLGRAHGARRRELPDLGPDRRPRCRTWCARWPTSRRRRRAPTPSSASSMRAAPRPSTRLRRSDRRSAARPVRRRRDPGRRRHVDQHERQRGDRQPRARAPGLRAGPLRRAAPNDHVNASQSTNDVYPTALRLAAWIGIEQLARRDGRRCAAPSSARPRSSRDVLKIGRTQLQDAVPMTLGQEFLRLRDHDRRRRGAAARSPRADHRGQPRRHRHRHRHQCAGRLCAKSSFPLLAEFSGVPVVHAANLVEATQDTGAFVQLSGVLKRVACKLSARPATTCACCRPARRPASATSACRRARPARRSCRARSTR